MSKGYNEFELSAGDRAKMQAKTIKSLHGQKKIAHIFRYYKVPIIILALVIAAVGFTVHQVLENRYQDILYVGIVNCPDADTQTMEADILELLGSGDRFETVTVDNAIEFTAEGEDVYESNVKLFTYTAIGEIDVIICDSECFGYIKDEYVDGSSAVHIDKDSSYIRKYGLDGDKDYIACKGVGIRNEDNAQMYLEYIRKNN